MRYLAYAFAFAFVLASGTAIVLEIDYSRRMPRTPSPATGQTIPMTVNHGYRIYVSPSEKRIIDVVEEIAAPVTFVGTAVSVLLWQRRKRSRSS
jgi:hypothetical protein